MFQLSVILAFKNASEKPHKFKFHTPTDAENFTKYVFTRNEFGTMIQSCFESLDRKGIGRLSPMAVKQGLVNAGFAASEADIRGMLSLHGADGVSMDFDTFFKVFLDVHVYTIRECLQEWLLQGTGEQDKVT